MTENIVIVAGDNWPKMASAAGVEEVAARGPSA